MAVVAVAASLGKYAGPLWWARCTPLAGILGPHDPLYGRPPDDPFLGDGAGSFYSLLLWCLPGFDAFRYPAKLFPFFVASAAVLAGLGWDRVASGESSRLRTLAAIVLAMSLAGLTLTTMIKDPAVAWLSGRTIPEVPYGPADIPGAWRLTQRRSSTESSCQGSSG